MPVHTHRASVHTQDGWSQAQRQLSRRESKDYGEEAVAARATGRDLHMHGYGAHAGRTYSHAYGQTHGYGQTGQEGGRGGLRNRRRSHRHSDAEEHGQRDWDGDRQMLLGEPERKRYAYEAQGGGHDDTAVYPLPRPRHSQAERKSSPGLGTPNTVPLYARRASTRASTRADALIDLEADHRPDRDPTSPQDAEIRQVIFNYPASTTPSISGRSSPAPALSRKVSQEHLSALGGMATLRPAGAYAPQVPSQLAVPDDAYDHEEGVHAQTHWPGEATYAYPQPSTTFSFLSLSGASSPAVPTSVLGGSWHAAAGAASPAGLHQSMHELQLQFPSMHAIRDLPDEPIDTASDEGEHALARSVPELSRSRAHLSPGSRVQRYPRAQSDDGRADDYDILSIPDTTASSYADAESYTPNESRTQSPSFPSFPSVPSASVGSARSLSRTGGEAQEMGAGELGLTFVRSPRGAPLSLAALQLAEPAQAQTQRGHVAAASGRQGERNTFGRRGPMSVISLSDSEAERSDWEAV